MSKFADALRAHRIFNDHHLTAHFGTPGVDDLTVAYCPSGFGTPGCTYVHSPSHTTDPRPPERRHWQDKGMQNFVGPRAESFPRALAWASERYGVDGWVTSPFGGGAKVPAVVVQRARAFLKDHPPES